MPAFERMLWRISRGNIFVRQSDLEIPLEDPQTVRLEIKDFNDILINGVFYILFREIKFTRPHLLHSSKEIN